MDAATGNILNECCVRLGLKWEYDPYYKQVTIAPKAKIAKNSATELLHLFGRNGNTRLVCSLRHVRAEAGMGKLYKLLQEHFFTITNEQG